MIPQTRELIVIGAVIRTLEDNLDGATEERGALLTVSHDSYSTELFKTNSTNDRLGYWQFHYDGLGTGFELVSSPAYISPEAVKKLDTEMWINQLMSTTGRHRISDEVRAELMACETKTQMNKIFFEYVQSTPVEIQTISDEHKAMLDSIITPKTSPAYLSAQRQHKHYIDSANSRMRNVVEYLEAATKEYDKMLQIEGNSAVPLSDKIADILSTGWYTLDPDTIKEANGEGIEFITPPITIAHYNSKAGIEMKVPMGQYRVSWRPRAGIIHAWGDKGHITVDGYQHPHITSGGDICWGNASTTYTEAMGTYNPKPAFEALQVILQNYNPDSPYVRLDRWEVQRNADKYAGMDTKYIQMESLGWIDTDDMPDSWATTYQHAERGDVDDGDHQYLMTVFRKVYANGADIPYERDNEIYYIKYANGRYCSVVVQEWD